MHNNFFYIILFTNCNKIDNIYQSIPFDQELEAEPSTNCFVVYFEDLKENFNLFLFKPYQFAIKICTFKGFFYSLFLIFGLSFFLYLSLINLKIVTSFFAFFKELFTTLANLVE